MCTWYICFRLFFQDDSGASEGVVLRPTCATRRRAMSQQHGTVASEERKEEAPRGHPESGSLRAPPGRDSRVGCVRDALGAARAAGTMVALIRCDLLWCGRMWCGVMLCAVVS